MVFFIFMYIAGNWLDGTNSKATHLLRFCGVGIASLWCSMGHCRLLLNILLQRIRVKQLLKGEGCQYWFSLRFIRGRLDLFRSMQVNQQVTDHPNQGSMVLVQHAPESLSFDISDMEDINQEMLLFDAIELNGVDKSEALLEGLNDVREDSGHSEEKHPAEYHRLKWTDEMVKLLITAVSYIGEDAMSNRIFIKGKWRAISCVMAERGHHVSPQQCEDKFNDLNKKFKRLNDVLGRGTACQVVENPAMLETMDLSDDLKEEMSKLLGSKQLFYQEMCSYNNRNRIFLPHDQEVQQSVLLAMKGKDKSEPKNMLLDLPLKRKNGEERGPNMACASLNCTTTLDPNLVQDMPAKRKVGEEERALNMAPSSLNCTTALDANVLHPNSNDIHVSMNSEEREIQDEHILPYLLQLEEQKLQIQAQILELEKRRFKCMRFCSKKDEELQKMMLDNEVIKLENQRLVLELKRREMPAL